MGGAVSAGESNDDLIDNLLEADYIKSPVVERVFRAVDRAHYLTPDFKDNAYKDLAWKSGNLHLSAPCIYSEVMESLQLTSGLSFLNLGSGTGYLSTMVGLILGPYGINHGVEIHEDVVNYANKKLDEFWNRAAALDEHEFCKPTFLKGNCLNLNLEERQYDRVYCGAACPEHHESYMKNLLKVGGVLVMPLHDQLLQVTRTSDTAWEVKAVLPVSFASLLLDQSNGKDQVALPDSEPLSLQDACRSSIRCTLRQIIESEHPDLTTRQQRTPKRRVRRRAIRRLVIPIFEDSDGEESAVEREGDAPALPGRGLIYSVQRQRAGQITAVIELARSNRHYSLMEQITRVGGPVEEDESEEEEEVPEEQAVQSSSTVDEQRKYIPKREKFDSGLGDEMENGKGLSSDSDGGASMEVDSSDSEASESTSTPLAMEEQVSLADHSEVSQHIDIGHLFNTSNRMTYSEEDSDDDNDDDPYEGSYFAREPTARVQSNSEEDTHPEVKVDTYSYFMKQKIQALPLPPPLKLYVNLYRDF